MPPHGRVETLPPRPSDDAVWVDGGWLLAAGRWVWRPGRWLVPPKGAVYAPWTVVRLSSGILRYAPGVWRDGRQHKIPEPEPILLAEEARGTADPAQVYDLDASPPPPSFGPPKPREPDASAPSVRGRP